VSRIPNDQVGLLSFQEKAEVYLLACKRGDLSFGGVLKVLDTYFKRLAGYYYRTPKYYVREFDQEDYYQLVCYYWWRALEEFQFVCSACDFRVADQDAFLAHLTQCRGSARQTLFDYCRFCVGARIRNEAIKRTFAQKAARVEISLFREDGTIVDIASDDSFSLEEKEDYDGAQWAAYVLCETTRASRGNLDQIIVFCLLKGMKQSEIAKYLLEAGIYSCLASARSEVSRRAKKVFKQARNLVEKEVV